MSNHSKSFVEVTMFELNLCSNQFDLPVRSMELRKVKILVFFGAWLLYQPNKREMTSERSFCHFLTLSY